MKNFVICAIVLILVLFAGCGETAEKPANDENQTEDTEQTGLNDADDTAVDEDELESFDLDEGSGDPDVPVNVSDEDTFIISDLDAETGDQDVAEKENLAQNIKTSGCGGFHELSTLKDTGLKYEELVDCSQVLIWKYDDSTDVVEIVVTKTPLSCLGAVSVVINQVKNGYDYVISQDPSGGDVGCSCLFDFSAELPGITTESLNLTVSRSAETGKISYWSGTIDLTQKGGEIIMIERTSDGCE
ncbi:MAG TPA: hypothetical protein P5044_05880 [bacterium]|nr:hypothetical protein [bacterium]